MNILEQPNRIYNCNETGFLMAQHPTKVITSKGNPHIYQQGAFTKAKSLCYSQPVPLHITSPPCGLSRAIFSNNIYRGVLQNFPRGSVWTLAPWVDGSGLALQLARAKLYPQNQTMSCAKAGTATD